MGSWRFFEKQTVCKIVVVFGVVFSPLSAFAALSIEAETLMRFYERDTLFEKDQEVLALYEYFQLDSGELDSDGFSVHGYGWGRSDLIDNGVFDKSETGELLYGYVQYKSSQRGYEASIGRQQVFTGIRTESLDGISLSGGIGAALKVEIYGGIPQSVETVNGRSGDSIYGGRLGYTLLSLYGLGVSYAKAENDSEIADESYGVDISLSIPLSITTAGYSIYNMETDDWKEHSYEAKLPLGSSGISLNPVYKTFNFDDYFDNDETTASPFRFLVGEDEKLTITGADIDLVFWELFDLALTYKHYDYDKLDETSDYYSARGVYNLMKNSQLGLEAGVMNGEQDENKYGLVRADLYLAGDIGFLSADFIYVSYKEKINDEDKSIFGSLSVGSSFMDDMLEVKLSGDASSDPYFDSDVRGLLSLTYTFEK